MGRTLEIEIYGIEYDFCIGQIKDIDVEEIEDVHFSDFEEKYPDHLVCDWFTFLTTPLYVNITIMNECDIEEKVVENANLEDIFNIKYQKLLYWGRKDKRNTDMQLVKLDKSLVTYVGYYFNKGIYSFADEDFKGKFDKNLLTALINDPGHQDEYWPSDGNYLHSIYYGNKRIQVSEVGGDGKGSDTIAWDKGWNKTTPVLYLKPLSDILR